MAPKREQSLLDDLSELLKFTPIWVGPVLAIAMFGAIRYLLPLVLPTKTNGLDVGSVFRPILPLFSWLAGGTVLLAWVIAEFYKLANRRLLDGQSSVRSIRVLSWRDFEHLVSEAYRRKGYLAEVVGNGSGDGGVDIRLRRAKEAVLVQCKQWRAWTVGVTTVRELLGVVVSEQATGGILVTSGKFTQEARDFAHRNKQIELLDGAALAELIRGVQANLSGNPIPTGAAPANERTDFQDSPSCPSCGEDMVLRTARKGMNAGSQFWGCSKYPACRGTREYDGATKGSRQS